MQAILRVEAPAFQIVCFRICFDSFQVCFFSKHTLTFASKCDSIAQLANYFGKNLADPRFADPNNRANFF